MPPLKLAVLRGVAEELDDTGLDFRSILVVIAGGQIRLIDAVHEIRALIVAGRSDPILIDNRHILGDPLPVSKGHLLDTSLGVADSVEESGVDGVGAHKVSLLGYDSILIRGLECQ